MILRRRGYKMAAPKNHVNLSQNDPAMKEMLKPLIFGNYQKMFGIFTFIVSAGKYLLQDTFILCVSSLPLLDLLSLLFSLFS